MPAAAVASRTPAIAGMSGTVVGARGETVVDMVDLQELCCRAGGGSSLAPESRATLPAQARTRDMSTTKNYCFGAGAGAAGAAPGAAAAGGGSAGRSRRSILAVSRSMRDEFGLRLARDIGLDLILDLVEFRHRARALVLDLDDVPAELRLHRIGDLARIHLERDLGEFRHHLALDEIAEVAAVGGARILRLLLRQLGEIGAALELLRRSPWPRPRSRPGCGGRAPLPRRSST